MGEKAIAHYEKLGIDPQSKTLVSLTIWIYAKRLSYTATSLPGAIKFWYWDSPDLRYPPGKTLNIVIKLVECNGKPVAKLSEALAKLSATIKRLFGRCAKR